MANVGPVGGGAGATAPDPLRTGGNPGQVRAASAPETSTTPAGDSVTSFLATGKIADLIAGIDQRRPVQSPEVIAELTRAAVSAAEQQDFVRALERVRELVAMDPERAGTLAAGPELDTIRAQVSQLLGELAAAAQFDAGQKLASAHQALASGGAKLPEPDRADLRAILSVAVQLMETGRHAGFVKAGELAEVVMGQCGWTPAGVPVWAPVEVANRKPWQRAPLPMLTLAWLALGILGAVPFAVIRIAWPYAVFALAVWGIGFAVLLRVWRRQAAATRKAT